MPPLTRTKSINEQRNLLDNKIESLNLEQTKERLRASAKLIPLADTQKKQEQKAREAAEYRAKILKQQSKTNQAEDMSPNFGREQALRKARRTKDTEARKRSDAGKATTAETAFNLANILMVSFI